MAYKRISPQPVVEGGTGAATLTGIVTGNGTSAVTANAVTQHGVLIGGASNAASSLAVASTGATLMGSTGADPAFTGSPSFSGSVTAGTNITATSGNFAITAATTSSVGQITQASTRIFHTFGSNQTFVGNSSGNFTLTTGSAINNTGLGFQTLLALTTGNRNTAVGTVVGAAVTTGSNNTMMGNGAGTALTTGSDNTLLGQGAGQLYTSSESSNIQIGSAVNSTAGESNVLRIGTGTGTSQGNINTAIISGITGKTSSSGVAVLVNSSNVLGTTTSSLRFKNNIQNMGSSSEAIYKLRPVTFNYKVSKPHVNEEDASLRQYGLIAEEVEKVMPDLVCYHKDGQIESVRYLHLIPILLNEVQKLRKELNELKKK